MRVGRVHENPRWTMPRLARALVIHGAGGGLHDGGADHRHEPAFGHGGGQRAGGDRGDGDADRHVGERGVVGFDGGAWGERRWRWAGLPRTRRMGRGGSIEALENPGQAADWFGRMVAAQGGPADFVDRWPDRLPSAPVMVEVPCCDSDGYVHRSPFDGQALGQAVVHLGRRSAARG